MKILLIGVTGQVGRELERTLSSLGVVTSLRRSDLDLCNPVEIRRVINAKKPELLVNAAAYTAVDRAETDENLAMAVNGKAPAIMAEALKQWGGILVHYSTDYVFDGSKKGSYTEQDDPAPLNVYGLSKLEGEEAIKNAGIPYFILRTSWIYGARGQNFLHTMIRLMKEREHLRVVADQLGAPTWCRNIAETTAQILSQVFSPLSKFDFEKHGGIYHLSAGGTTSWHGFAEAIRKHFPYPDLLQCKDIQPIKTEDYPLPAPRPRNSVLDGNRLKKSFGLSLPNWEICLKQVLEDLTPEDVIKGGVIAP